MKKVNGIFRKPIDFFILRRYNYLAYEIFVYKIYGFEMLKEGEEFLKEYNERIDVLKTLKSIMNMIHKNMESEFKGLKITGPQGMIIGILMHHGEMKISDLSEKMGLSSSTVSGIVDRLEKQGMVKRIRSSDDRRVVYVKVDEDFKKRSKESFKNIYERFETIMSKATDEEIADIVKGLNTLKKLIESSSGQSSDNFKKGGFDGC